MVNVTALSLATRLQRLHDAIEPYHYAATHEKELQQAIGQVLIERGFGFEREVRLTPEDVVDFVIAPGIGMEVKMDGGLSALTRQLHRYAQSDKICALLLVTTLSRLANLPLSLSGKPLDVVCLRGGLR